MIAVATLALGHPARGFAAVTAEFASQLLLGLLGLLLLLGRLLLGLQLLHLLRGLLCHHGYLLVSPVGVHPAGLGLGLGLGELRLGPLRPRGLELGWPVDLLDLGWHLSRRPGLG